MSERKHSTSTMIIIINSIILYPVNPSLQIKASLIILAGILAHFYFSMNLRALYTQIYNTHGHCGALFLLTKAVLSPLSLQFSRKVWIPDSWPTKGIKYIGKRLALLQPVSKHILKVALHVVHALFYLLYSIVTDAELDSKI